MSASESVNLSRSCCTHWRGVRKASKAYLGTYAYTKCRHWRPSSYLMVASLCPCSGTGVALLLRGVCTTPQQSVLHVGRSRLSNAVHLMRKHPQRRRLSASNSIYRMASASTNRSFSWSSLSTDFYYRPAAEINNVGTYRVVTVHPAEYYDPITCSLFEVSLKDTTVKFIALSYCWNSSAAEETIWCDGRPLKITANLFAALRNARPRNSVVRLWIDQVCVDQGNIIDRNEQVSRMGHIYRAAHGVIVWLGEESPGSSAAMDLPRMIKRYWSRLYDNPNELTDFRKTPPECDPWGEGAWPAFVALLTRSWWKRLWVSFHHFEFMSAHQE